MNAIAGITSGVCPLCQETSARTSPIIGMTGLLFFDCPVCDRYYLEYRAQQALEPNSNLSQTKLMMVAETINNTRKGMIMYWSASRIDPVPPGMLPDRNIIYRTVEDAQREETVHSQKMNNLLLTLARNIRLIGPFDSAHILKKDFTGLRIKDRTELAEWMQTLIRSGYVESSELAQASKVMQRLNLIASTDFRYQLTPLGWQHIAELNRPIHATKAFIAMRFSNNPERPQIQDALVRACRDTGWDASTIDEEEYVGGISDQIIAKINQARFVLAEFTGQNHGVYYEAGYAAGRSLPVIQMVKHNEVSTLHFDTRHLNHIVWTDYEDLYSRVKSRIQAVINK